MLNFLAISVQLFLPEMNYFLSDLLITIDDTRKRQKYEELFNEQHKYYEKVKFVN